MTNETIKVSIAKLGNAIQEVELNVDASVMDALKKADYNLDAVLSVKRNGSVVSMDTGLVDGDVLLVSQDKIKGGADEESEGNLIKLNFDITTDGENNSKGMLFLDTMSAFEIIKTVLHGKGISMNYFKELRSSEGVKLGLDSKLVDGTKYIIVLEKATHCVEEDEEDDE